MRRYVGALIGAFLVMAGPVAAQTLGSGLDAFKRNDYATALAIWYALAECGDPNAQADPAAMYRDGLGTPRDYVEAAKWFRQAAVAGVVSAQAGLGQLLSAGQGLRQDNAEAVKWLRLAADRDFPQAQNDLGIMYAQGRGVEKDMIEAMKWFLLAARHVDDGARNRDDAAKNMTADERAQAERRAAGWKAPGRPN